MRAARAVGLVGLPALLALGPADPAAAVDLDTLVSWMTGSFSSEAQAAADSAYFDIRLEMVPIWTERTDGRWLYVEQAAARSLERPYRQRVYRVTREEDGAWRSEVFALPEPLRFAGAWRETDPLAALTPDSLTVRDGCAVILREFVGGIFVGATEGTGCASSLRGASWATSEVRIGYARIESWDRGFDAAGAQVWGAEKGAYVFLRTGMTEEGCTD